MIEFIECIGMTRHAQRALLGSGAHNLRQLPIFISRGSVKNKPMAVAAASKGMFHMTGLHRLIICVFALGVCLIPSAPSWAVPSFARQTGMTCAACHTVFPELTPFGREFKLNGYVLDNIKQVTGIDTSGGPTLAINSIPPISLMAQISYTHTSKAMPDSVLTGALAKDGDLAFPQQVS